MTSKVLLEIDMFSRLGERMKFSSMKTLLKVILIYHPICPISNSATPLASNHNPYYIREHSKRILRGALYNDSKFLADINVMDYSLVCGVGFLLLVASLSADMLPQVDSTKNELVVGIVGKVY